MYYTIYKVINKINGKFYIGKHQTSNINDGYYGSGVNISKALKKYGKENFYKEILYVFETEREMNDKEKEILTEDFISCSDNYNAGIGGEGGPHFKGKKHSKETKKKQSEWAKKRIVSDETRKKLSEANRLRDPITLSEETKQKISKARTGKKHSEKTKQKISESLKRKNLSRS